MRMQRLTPYLGIVAALAIAFFVVLFTTAPAAAPVISITSEIVAPASVATSSLAADVVATSSVATTMPVTRPAKVVPEPLPKSETVVVTKPIPTAAELDAAAALLRAALVNIICYAPAGSGLHSTSGSGIVIDSKGIILTNAHVALPFLFADRGVSCVIRAGSPAADKYEAALIYFSLPWVQANADILTKVLPKGTGEYDFALLAVTKGVNGNTPPSSFPLIPLATAPPVPDTPVVIASYGAQFLESSQVRSSLFPTIVFGSVKDVFTFASTTTDVLALGGSAAAQEGSSGGGVADVSSALIGTITTSTTKGTTDMRKLDAITASYIRAEYASETGQALDLLLAKPVSFSIANFAPQIPELESILIAHLP